jgi:biopolymer transport protein ExbD
VNLRPRRQKRPLLDLTPLIDVVFLLLIFFMVSTTFDKQTRLKVDLPQASTANAAEEQTPQIKLTIDAGGHFYVNDREVISTDADTLRRALEKAAGGKTDIPVVITVDKTAPFQAPMTAMDAASQAGLSRLRFVANKATADTR